jgi:predicted transposase/invertase (TIGR01784 family)
VELLMRRFTELNREEVRRMFQLHDPRERKVWQEAHGEGRNEGREEGQEMKAKEYVKRLQRKGMSLKAIADLLEIPLVDVRRLARRGK